MAIKTYVDGGKQAITFNNNTQPIAVYVDGDLQENVSFVPDTVQGTGSVEYLSEYKKNHIEYEIQGVTSQTPLPAEYQQVEYIESTGTQYIDTGVIPNNETGCSIDVSFPNVSIDAFRFGCRKDGGDTRFILGTNNGIYFGFGKTILLEGQPWSIAPNTFNNAKLNFLNSRVANVNNNNDVELDNLGVNDMVYSIIMFGRNSGGNISSSAQSIKHCQISQGTEIIRDFIPCYRKADDVIGMYDLVNGVFYTNSGTGAFVKGDNSSSTLEIENANDNGMSVVLRGENLFNAQSEVESGNGLEGMRFGNNYIENLSVAPSAANRLIYSKVYKAGTYTISAKGEYAGNSFTFRFLCTAKYNGGTYNSYYKGYYFDWLKNTLPQNSFTFTTTEDFQIGFVWSASTTYLRGIIYDIMLIPTSQAVEYKPYVEETIEIPTSIDINGTNVPLLFSEYDKLTVDRINNEVIYHNGGYSKTLNGNEAMGSSTTLSKVWVTIPFELTGDGFCNQFLSPTDFIFANNLSFGDSGMAFPMSRFSSTNALAAFLAEQYNNGTPVVILAQKETPTPYNITNTVLGQLLLNLDTQNQTNYFEITSNANAPQTPIKFTFAKWGGRNENNNNT